MASPRKEEEDFFCTHKICIINLYILSSSSIFSGKTTEISKQCWPKQADIKNKNGTNKKKKSTWEDHYWQVKVLTLLFFRNGIIQRHYLSQRNQKVCLGSTVYPTYNGNINILHICTLQTTTPPQKKKWKKTKHIMSIWELPILVLS